MGRNAIANSPSFPKIACVWAPWSAPFVVLLGTALVPPTHPLRNGNPTPYPPPQKTHQTQKGPRWQEQVL